ncbi:hypothetical protein L7F22_060057 [Adiantum nelumboides]|nr:hypothetical protein [Adiantum nelumboides]
MGALPSKEQETRDGWKASLSRSVSAPTSRDPIKNESAPTVSWKSKLFSMPQSRRGTSFKSGWVMSKLKPVREEEAEVDFDDLPEAFEVDQQLNGLTPKRQNGSFFNRSVSFQPSSETESRRRLIAPCKSFRESRGECETASCASELMDQSIGLRLLLNSSSSLSSQSLVSPSRGGACLEKLVSTKESLYSRHGNDFTRRSLPRVCMDDASPLEPQWVAASSTLTEQEIPVFDPSLLATFEKAVDDVALSTQETSLSNKSASSFVSPGPGFCSDTSKSKQTGYSLSRLKTLRSRAAVADSESSLLSPGICLDTDKSKLIGRSLSRLKSLKPRIPVADRPIGNAPELTTFPFLNRKPSFSKVFSLKNDKRNWSSETYLDKFVKMCPPGSEGKVVLYFTSLRGVRKTFENCFMVRLILQGFRVHVDERDVWMHSKFRQELTDVMGAALSVPRLFILGRYIGGADEVELLHEEGILLKLLEDLPTECRKVCDICADVRFIPCTACSGSCKIVMPTGATERCAKCNENGLIMCPICV